MRDGQRQWLEFDTLEWNDEDFPRIGEAFAHETGLERRGPVALAEARLMPQHALVDYAVTWMEQHRPDRS